MAMDENQSFIIEQGGGIEYEYQQSEEREFLQPRNVVFVQDDTLYDDANVYYEDEIVAGTEWENVDDTFEDVTSDMRLMMYPDQKIVKLRRVFYAEPEEIPDRTLFLKPIVPPDLDVPDSPYDIEMTTEAEVTLPNYEINRNYSEPLDPEDIFVTPEEAQNDYKLTPLPDKYFVRRSTSDASTVGLHSLAVICPDCHFCFRTKTAFSKHEEMHKETNDPDKLLPRTQIVCPIPECDIRADCLATLIEHVRSCHHRTDMCFESIDFEDMEQFKLWKSEMERLTMSRYTRSSGKHNVFSKSTYFHCHYSGTVPTAKPNTQRNRQSKKMGKSCTAFFHIKEKEDGRVFLRGCVKHVGHEPNVKTMPLSDQIKKEIATYLLEGLSDHEIVELLRERSGIEDRRHYIQPYEVRNVQNKLAKHQYAVNTEEDDDDENYVPQDEMIEYQTGPVPRPRLDIDVNGDPNEPSTSTGKSIQEYDIPPPYAAVEEVCSSDYQEPVEQDAIPLDFKKPGPVKRGSSKRTHAEMENDTIQATVDVRQSKTLEPKQFTKRKYDPITGMPVKRGPKSKAHKELLEKYHEEQARLLETMRIENEKAQKKNKAFPKL